jgi:hypothetical protein
MHTPLLPDFHPQSLRQAFIRNAAQALTERRLSSAEHRELLALCDNPNSESLQVGHLSIADTPQALADVLLISRTAPDQPELYLSSALYGVERFNDRHQLNNTLLQREPQLAAGTILAYERIEGPLFERQMQSLIERRLKGLEQLSEQLQQLPDLPAILLGLFLQKIGLLRAATLEVPANLLLQHVDNQRVTRILDLQQALIEHYMGQTLPNGQVRRWLTPEGQPMPADDAQAFERALVSPSDDLSSTYTQYLQDYWSTAVAATGSRRELAARALAHGFAVVLARQYHEGLLAADEIVWLKTLPHTTGSLLLNTLTLFDTGQKPLALAGAWVVQQQSGGALYLYDIESGLQRFDALADLQQHFTALDKRHTRVRHLAWPDRSTLYSLDTPQLGLTPCTQPLFVELADSLVRLQARNLTFALQHPDPLREKATAHLDDALDLRALLDPRLLSLDDRGRWHDTVAHAPWSLEPLAPEHAWLTRLNQLILQQQALQQVQPGLQACARNLLNRRLAVMTHPRLDAGQVLVQYTETPDEQDNSVAISDPAALRRTSTLSDLFIESVTGHRPFNALSTSAQLIVTDGLTRPHPTRQMPPALLDYLLEHSAVELRPHHLQAAKRSRRQWRREGGSRWQPGQMLQRLFDQALRIEMQAKGELLGSNANVLDTFTQVLDLPRAALRHHLGNAKSRVHGLILKADADPAQARLACTFVVHRNSQPRGEVFLWSPVTHFKRFTSLDELRTQLLADMTSTQGAEPWLNLIAETDRVAMRRLLNRTSSSSPKLDTLSVEGNLFEYLELSHQQWVEAQLNASWDLGMNLKFEARPLCELMASSQRAEPVEPDLAALIDNLNNAALTSMLPDWARNATFTELETYANLLQHCLRGTEKDNNYLFGIESLNRFARAHLRREMEDAYGSQVPDPDHLMITLKHYITAIPAPGETPGAIPAATTQRTLSLTECALRHFSAQESLTSVAMADASSPPAWFTPTYAARLVKRLDLGGLYRAMLADHLGPENDTHSARQRLFILNMSAQLLELAYRHYLQKRLSPLAYQYLESVIGMPDSIARQSVEGRVITLRPVRLVAEPGMKADDVCGLYLIGPQEPELGPVVLYAPYSKAYVLKEYANEAAFLEDARNSPALADLIVWRVEEQVRSRYDHGGLKEPHLPWSVESSSDLPLYTPAPVSLDSTPVAGHTLTFLFEDNVQLIQMLARRQTVTTAEAEWEAFKYLTTLGLEQGTLFLPGQLALLVAAWQSQVLLKSSVQSITERHWGQALSQFCAALVNLVSYRRSTNPPPVAKPLTTPTPPAAMPESPEFGWRHPQLSRELRERLSAFEHHEVALQDLKKDPLTLLYSAPGRSDTYAVIAGKVYPVARFDQAWYIVNGQQRGPRIRLTASQQWVLDLRWGLLGGGSGPSQIEDVEDHEVDKIFETTAEGMVEINSKDPLQARAIVKAHQTACRYLRVCLQNLNATRPEQPLPAQTEQIIRSFLQTTTLPPALLIKIRMRARELFTALLEPSLNPQTSQRIVVGKRRDPNEPVVAFTLTGDPQRRIFLTERFFNTPAPLFPFVTVPHRVFDISAHCQACHLIHELSHIVSGTVDIAYVESAAPYLDLLTESTSDSAWLKDALAYLQQRSLSLDTYHQRLFMMEDSNGLKEISGRGRARVLTITGRTSLAKAREDFYTDGDKRREIILSNADSLTLLISLLGRTLHASPTP